MNIQTSREAVKRLTHTGVPYLDLAVHRNDNEIGAQPHRKDVVRKGLLECDLAGLVVKDANGLAPEGLRGGCASKGNEAVARVSRNGAERKIIALSAADNI
jgi:hypothetical protein